MKYILLALVLLLTACAGPGGVIWAVLPEYSDPCPQMK